MSSRITHATRIRSMAVRLNTRRQNLANYQPEEGSISIAELEDNTAATLNLETLVLARYDILGTILVRVYFAIP